MKKLMTAALGLSLLSGTAVFAQNTSSDSMKDTAKSKKHKKSKKGDTATTSTSTSK